MSAVGQVFGNRYEIESSVARGGMAEVFLAHDRTLDRRVALKVLFAEYAASRRSSNGFGVKRSRPRR